MVSPVEFRCLYCGWGIRRATVSYVACDRLEVMGVVRHQTPMALSAGLRTQRGREGGFYQAVLGTRPVVISDLVELEAREARRKRRG